MYKLIKRIFFVTLFSLLVVSCNNLILNHNPIVENKIITVNGNVYTDSHFSRSAYPVLPDVLYYQVKATAEKDGQSIEVNGLFQAENSTYTIDLPINYLWTIVITCYQNYSDNEYSSPLYFGQIEYDLTSGNKPESSDMILNKFSEGTGNLSLPIEVDAGIFTKCIIEWKNFDDESWVSSNTQTVNFSSSNLLSYFNKNDLETGCYNIRLKFYNGDSLLGTINESFYIVGNQTTDTWCNSSSIYIKERNGKNTLYFTEELAKFYLSKYFYIEDSGDDSNSGSFYTPFKTIQHAVDIIEMINDSTSNYYIYLKSDISVEYSSVDSNIDGDCSVLINPANQLNLIVSSYNNSVKRVVTAANDSRVFYCGENCNLLIDSLVVRNGNALNGAGIYSKGFLRINNCIIQDNTATKNGGGIYSVDNDLYIDNTVLSKNISNDTGGAIFHSFSSNNSTISFKMSKSVVGGDSNSDGNYAAKHAGGIYLYQTKGEISNCTISYNKTSSTANSTGGGLWYKGTGLKFSGSNNIVSHNESLTGGGIFFNNGVADFESIDITDNLAIDSGAGVYAYLQSDIRFNGVTKINNNTANAEENGLGGAGIFCKDSNIELTNNSTVEFKSNHSELWAADVLVVNDSNVTIRNAVSSGNTLGKEINESTSTKPAGYFMTVYQTSQEYSPVIKIINCILNDESSDNYDIYQNSGNAKLYLNESKLHRMYSIAPIYIEGNVINDISSDGKILLTIPDSPSSSTTNKETLYYADSIELLKGTTALISSNYTKFELSNSDYELNSSGYVKKVPLESLSSLISENRIPVEGKTYSVSSESELNYIATLVYNNGQTLQNVTFKQLNDIDLQNHDFLPIGCGNKPFKGNFDGQYYKIIGLKNDINYSHEIGLFGYTYGSTISNLYVSGVVAGDTHVGGIVGQAVDTIIHDCVSDVEVSGSDNYVGGICGQLSDTIIYNCINIGKICGTGGSSRYIGGITGNSNMSSAFIANCANFGEVQGYSDVSGICGYNKGSVFNIYNCGSISGTTNAGQIVGTDSNGRYGSYYYKGPDLLKVFGNDSETSDYRLDINLLENLLDSGKSSITCDYTSQLNNWNYELIFDGVAYPVCTKLANGLDISADKILITSSLADLVGDPVENCVYSISTKDELFKLSSISNSTTYSGNFTNVTFVLLNDIDLECSESNPFKPIGFDKVSTTQRVFSGSFDGRGHIIKGLYCQTESNYGGLFGYGKNCKIKNLLVAGEVQGVGYTGGIVGYAMGVSSNRVIIDSCVSNVKITTSSGTCVGGIVGGAQYYTDIINCVNIGSISGNSTVGGIIGSQGSNSISVQNCANYGKIYGSSNIGGIMGSGNIAATSKNNLNIGNVSCENISSCGAICGGSFSNPTASENLFYLKGSCDAIFGNGVLTSLFVNAVEESGISGLKDSLNNYITSSSGFDDPNNITYKKWDKTYNIAGIDYPLPVSIPDDFYNIGSTINQIILGEDYISFDTLGSAIPQSGDKIRISSPEDFIKMSQLCYTNSSTHNELENVTFALDRNIDMNGVEYKSPGFNKQYFFKGIIDGNGCTISNLKIKNVSSGSHGNGFIGNAGDGTIIRNLNLENLSFDTDAIYRSGGIVGFAQGNVLIENCNVNMNIFSTTGRIGGIVGDVDSGSTVTVRNCVTTGTLSGTNSIGGIVGGDSGGTIIVENCASYCDIIHTNGLSGGIVWKTLTAESKILNCVFGGTITFSSSSGQIGPIANVIYSGATESNYKNLYYNNSFYINGVYNNSSSFYNSYKISDDNKFVLTDTTSDIKSILNNWVYEKGSDYKLWEYDLNNKLVLVK